MGDDGVGMRKGKCPSTVFIEGLPVDSDRWFTTSFFDFIHNNVKALV
jgi:hypothetical protein